MSGFDLASLLPYYLDETDEQIAGLSDALLKLERSPTEEPTLRDAFRLIHTIKGSAMVLGFGPVKDLTHHLEAYFEQLRSKKRTLDRAALDLCFRCLDALRDYHQDLRSKGDSAVDLESLAALVDQIPNRPAEPVPEPAPEPVPEPAPEPEPEPEPAPANGPRPPGAVCLTLQFEPNLPWPDMKAKLVLNRLAVKGRILTSEPAADRLEDVEDLRRFRIWLDPGVDVKEMVALADVDGVAEVRADPVEGPGVAPEHGPGPEPEPEPEAPAPEAAGVGVAAVPPPGPRIAEVGAEPGPGSRRSATPAARPVPKDEPPPERPVEPMRPRVAETVRVDVERLDQLMNLAGELVISKSRFLEIARRLDDLFRDSNAQLLASDTLDRLDGIARGLEGREEGEHITPESIGRWAAQVRRLRENFRAIEAELDLIRQGRERLGAMSEAIDHLSRVSDGIQRGVLETRMVPVGPLFERFHRVIRDLKQFSKKEVALRIEGEKTELDKRMIDELGDPLVHLIRNAVDHGLESPEARLAAGKPRVGTVSMTASHRGNSVVITVSDDGRGIDREKVRRKAVARGLIGEDESRRLSDRQVIQYIFHPGLSTAETVTEISGRGVGMDIVKSRIEALNGSVEARPEPGRGTTFTIRLPLTLAIMSVLLVRVGEEAYAIPLDHLDEIVEVGRGQVYRVHGRRSIEIRGRFISLVALGDVFRQDGLRRTGDEAEALDEKYTVVLVSNGESSIGLIVDELLGIQEAVLKSLDRNFRPVGGLSGASILGDGRVCLILDIDTLIDMASAGTSRPAAALRPGG